MKTLLTEEQKAKVSELTGLLFEGKSISFFLKGELLGSTELPENSFQTQRDMLAEMLNIKEYDDFILYNRDGGFHARASEQHGLGHTLSGIDADYGTACGLAYKLKREGKLIS